MKSKNASLVMIAGALAYLITVTNRSSMGVASLLASQKFEVAATSLSTLAVAQLVVYAIMQVPVESCSIDLVQRPCWFSELP